MSIETIHALANKAARESARKGEVPYMVWPQDVEHWKAQIQAGKLPPLPFPFIGSRHPRGYRKVEEYFVDSSGFGAPGEPALTIPQFVDRIKADRAYAITEAGQFQVYITEYRKTSKEVDLREAA